MSHRKSTSAMAARPEKTGRLSRRVAFAASTTKWASEVSHSRPLVVTWTSAWDGFSSLKRCHVPCFVAPHCIPTEWDCVPVGIDNCSCWQTLNPVSESPVADAIDNESSPSKASSSTGTLQHCDRKVGRIPRCIHLFVPELVLSCAEGSPPFIPCRRVGLALH